MGVLEIKLSSFDAVTDRLGQTAFARAPMRISFAGGGTDVAPYPQREGGAVLSELDNFNSVVTEIWRVCEPNAVIEIAVPFFPSTKFYSEPDHRIPFGIRSFDNYRFIGERKQWKLKWRTNYESDAQFAIDSKRFHFSNFALLSWLDRLINLEPVIFERFFATLLTPEEVRFRLRVFKEQP